MTGASSYRVYRSDAVNGTAGSEHRIAPNVSGTSFTDDGVSAGTIPYLPEGALGNWVTLSNTLPAVRSNGAAVLALDPIGDPFIYVVGGTTDGTTAEADVWAMASDETWSVAGTRTTPRWDNRATLATPEQATALDGEDGTGASNNSEFAEILTGGALGTFASLTRQDANGQARVNGPGRAPRTVPP